MRPPLSEFLNTTAELHAFTLGLCEVLCPWPPRHPTMTRQLARELHREHHYYMLGRALAILAWVTICSVLTLIFF